MYSNRSQILYSKISKRTNKDDEHIYNELNAVQLEICERASALENKFTIDVVADKELYDYPDGLYINRVIHSNMGNVTEISINDLNNIKPGSADTIYYYKYNNQIGFILADGSIPSDVTIYIYGWRRPKEDGSEDISRTVDPILDRRWDWCLVLGALSRLVDDHKEQIYYNNLYEQEFHKQNLMENIAKDISFGILTNTDYD